MSAVEQAQLIGRTGQLFVREGLSVSVRVADVRQVFHRTDVRIVPLAGRGLAWVALDSVALDALEVSGA